MLRVAEAYQLYCTLYIVKYTIQFELNCSLFSTTHHHCAASPLLPPLSSPITSLSLSVRGWSLCEIMEQAGLDFISLDNNKGF